MRLHSLKSFYQSDFCMTHIQCMLMQTAGSEREIIMHLDGENASVLVFH